MIERIVDMAAVDLHRVPTDRSWTRDSLPTVVRRADGARGLVAWRFNAWAKYPNWRRDRAAAVRRQTSLTEIRRMQ